MSVEEDLLKALASDEALAALLGGAGRIQQGSFERRIPAGAPCILLEAAREKPSLQGMVEILADTWICSIDIMADKTANLIADRVMLILESRGFLLHKEESMPGKDLEMRRLRMRFKGERMR